MINITEYRLRIDFTGDQRLSTVSIQQKNEFVFLGIFKYTKWLNFYKKDIDTNPYLYCLKELTNYYYDVIHRDGKTCLETNISTNF